MTPVDVLVVNYGTGDLTARAVAAVAGPGVHVQVWDNSGEVLADPPAGVEVDGTGDNTYFAHGNNRLWEKGSAPYVLLLNPDVELSHADLERLVASLDARPGSWGVAPRLLDPDGSDQHYLHGRPDLPALLADRLPPLRRVLSRAHARYVCSDVDLRRSQVAWQPPAACLLLRRATVGPVLFDERYRLFFNDAELALRLNVSGTCWYDADVTAVHLRGESFRRVRPSSGLRIAREYDRTLLRYSRAHVRGWWVLVPVVALRLLASRVIDAVRRRPR